MKIYTKGGDKGRTHLGGGDRVDKNHPRLQAYGTLDELSAVIGMALSDQQVSHEVRDKLKQIQEELFCVASELAFLGEEGQKSSLPLIESSVLPRMENEIDQMESQLKPLKNFIFAGGSPIGSTVHLARTVCRRAEREIFTSHQAHPVREIVLQYVNRLSDYLFVLARYSNHLAGQNEEIWNGK